MLLTDDQRDRLAWLIVSFLGDDRFGESAAVLVGHDVVRRAAARPPFQHAQWLVDQTLVHPTPGLFVRLVSTVDVGTQLADLHQLAARLAAGELVWDRRLFEPVWLPDESPFADRDGLRAAITEMAEGGGHSAITIEAPPGHGKRTMSRYIKDCANRYGVLTPVVEDLQRLDTDEVVAYLVDGLWQELRLAGGPTTPLSGTPERRAADLAAELARKAVIAARPVWFVANVVRPDLDVGVWTFIDELMGKVRSDPLLAQRLKIAVLADFSAVELVNKPEVAARFTLPEIGESDVAGWLAAAVPGKQRRQYEVTAQLVIEQLARSAPSPAMRLRQIARLCAAAHKQLLESV